MTTVFYVEDLSSLFLKDENYSGCSSLFVSSPRKYLDTFTYYMTSLNLNRFIGNYGAALSIIEFNAHLGLDFILGILLFSMS